MSERWSDTPWLQEAIEAQERLNQFESQLLDIRMAGLERPPVPMWLRRWRRLLGFLYRGPRL